MKNSAGIMVKTICMVFIAAALMYMFVASGMVFSFFGGPEAKKPKVKRGEFPVSITYELNGETKTLEDVVVCKFKGFKSDGNHKYRVWKENLKSGNDSLVLLHAEEDGITYEISQFYGKAAYYMGDPHQRSSVLTGPFGETLMDDSGFTLTKLENGEQTLEWLTKEDALEKYGLKIIDMSFSKPISNSFN